MKIFQLKKIIVVAMALAIMLSVSDIANASEKDSINYIPQVHGTLRGRMEVSTVESRYRFQLRNARVSIGGNIARFADYYLQADFCDRGDIKFLDGWVRIKPAAGLSIQAGQFRMPCGVDPFRGPHTYLFANRSFIGKQMCNYRAVGAKVSYMLPWIPLSVEAGVFNPSKIDDHTPWNSTVAFAGKATYQWNNVSIATGFMSISPDSARTSITDFGITWKSGRWFAEGEYMYKHYNRDRHKASHGYNMTGRYVMPIKAGMFNRLSFEGRFDGMTAHSKSTRGNDGHLITNDPSRNRITIGSTISYVRKKDQFIDLRVNYEKYFYHEGYRPTPDNGDKAVVEIVVRF